MTDAPAPSPPPPRPDSAQGEAVPSTPEPMPKSRTWFVVLAWVTLVAFGIFVAGITAVTAAIPELKKAKEAGRGKRRRGRD
jgi:hypothetical protein